MYLIAILCPGVTRQQSRGCRVGATTNASGLVLPVKDAAPLLRLSDPIQGYLIIQTRCDNSRRLCTAGLQQARRLQNLSNGVPVADLKLLIQHVT